MRGGASGVHRIRHLATLQIHRVAGGIDACLDAEPGILKSLSHRFGDLGYQLLRLIAHATRAPL